MMRTRRLFAALLLMLVALSTQVTMAQEMPPIPVDEAIRIGKLDNGLTYYIRYNNYPEQRAYFYIAQRVGSMQEEDNQRGLAHFLEHMAFNGSEHFPGNGIIDYTRSLGVSFGRDLNAGTGFVHTVYNIDNVPTTRQSALDSCLLILKDWSHGLLLEGEEIDKERGVIHEEWRVRRTVRQRLNESILSTVYPGSRFGDRMIIGLMDVVDNFPHQVLRDYYHKWYRPDNQALVIVGDIDVDYTEAKIREMFSDIPAAAPDAPQVERYPVPDTDEPIFAIAQDKEQTRSELQVLFKHDITDFAERGNMKYFVQQYLRRMASTMLNARLSEKVKEPGCPYLNASCSDNSFLYSNTKDAFGVSASPKEGQVEASLQAILTEVLRAAQYGFTETEYARAQENYLTSMENIYKERDKISSKLLAMVCYLNYLQNEPIPSIEQEYELTKMLLPHIPVEAVNQVIPSVIGDLKKNLVVINFNQEKDGAIYPTSQTLQAAIDAARSADIEAYVDNVRQEPLIAKMPKKGKIVKESTDKTFGYKTLELSNGVRVVMMKTNYNENEITMTGRRHGGNSLLDEKDYVNFSLFNTIISSSKLGGFTRSELKKTLAGKNATAGLGMNTYFDNVSGFCSVKDVETLFQLAYLNFTDISKDEDAFNLRIANLQENLKNKDLKPEAAFADSVSYVLGNYNWRRKPLGVEDLQHVDYDRILQIAKDITANAADYTFYIVGNYDEATLRPLIEQYIASLPSKKGKKSEWKNVSDHGSGIRQCEFTRKMEVPMTNTYISWYDTSMPYTMENDIKADILGDVLRKIYTQKVREDAGATYSVSASGSMSLEGDRPYTSIGVRCPIKPEFADEMIALMNNEFAEVANNIDNATVNELKELLIKDYNNDIKENWYWLSYLIEKTEFNRDFHTGYLEAVKAQTPETIAAFARQIFNTGNKVQVVMKPAE